MHSILPQVEMATCESPYTTGAVGMCEKRPFSVEAPAVRIPLSGQLWSNQQLLSIVTQDLPITRAGPFGMNTWQVPFPSWQTRPPSWYFSSFSKTCSITSVRATVPSRSRWARLTYSPPASPLPIPSQTHPQAAS